MVKDKLLIFASAFRKKPCGFHVGKTFFERLINDTSSTRNLRTVNNLKRLYVQLNILKEILTESISSRIRKVLGHYIKKQFTMKSLILAQDER